MPRRGYRRVTLQDRKRIIEAYQEDEDFLTVTNTHGIKQTTAYDIVRKFSRTREVADRYKVGGHPKLFDNKSIDYLVMLTEANSSISVKDMNGCLQQTFQNKPHVSDSAVQITVDGELIKHSIRVKQACAEFADYMYEEDL